MSRLTTLGFLFAIAVACSSPTASPALDAGRDGGSVAPCPSQGTNMVRVGALCMDDSETSRAQYQAFLNGVSSLDRAKLPAECRTRPSFTPDASCVPDLQGCAGEECGKLPQTCVTYCDAAAYCAWVGKTLCGTGKGERAEVDSASTPSDLYWYQVCGGGTRDDGLPARRYAYGDTLDRQACNAGPHGSNRLEPVRSRPACRAIEAPIYDMNGNASEWLEGRDPKAAPGEGYVIAAPFARSSDAAINECISLGPGTSMNAALADLGFRCCGK